ncbi:MAG: OpgC domain-containing protein [Acidobacteria bacterium]|nr:OpgC domain-containing protein [Acidobacteriota bacterium]
MPELTTVMAAPATSTPPDASSSAEKKPRREPELDGLRGFFLVWMTLTHLPTRLSVYANQPFGIVSAAEGFIFLSALLCGKIFGRKLQEEGSGSVWRRLTARAGRLYAYHLALLGFAFTVVARIAIHTKQPSLQGLVDFYLAHPVDGIIASALLVYRPPLLDILPMYILFLLMTPAVLWAGHRWNWELILGASLLVWAAAQFGIRSALYTAFIHVTHVDIPFGALGAFDLYGWQFLWIAGLWVGQGRPLMTRFTPLPRFAIACSLVIAVCFCIVRHTHLWDVANAAPWLPLIDKWHLGPVRILNFTALTLLFSAVRPATIPLLGRGPLVSLGQASLEVFCAHLLVCFAGLALVGDGANASAWEQVLIIAAAVGFLYLTARLSAMTTNKMQTRPHEARMYPSSP